MDDLISRQDAIDAVNQYNFDFPQCMERFVTELRDAMKADLKHDIEALSSAPPEITVCADCKHWICHDRRCGYWNHGVKPLEWCCHAERRTDEGN